MDDFSEFYDSIANEYDEMTSDAGNLDGVTFWLQVVELAVKQLCLLSLV